MSSLRFLRTAAVLLVGAGLAGAGLLGVAAGPAAAASGSERIARYDVQLTVRPDGSMHVQETIEYDFGTATDRHGIKRTVPTVFGYDDTHNRVYPLSNWSASSPSGAPHDLDVATDSVVTLRVGDPDRTVRGVQTYVLNYDLGGVVNSLPDGQELYWNAIGQEWEVPIDQAHVVVEGPAAVARTACFEGAQGSTHECSPALAGGQARYAATGLAPGQGMTVVAGFPVGTFPGARPILREAWSVQRAFALTPTTEAGAIGAFAVLAGAAGVLVARRGRDERYLATIPGLEPAEGQDERTGRVSFLRRDAVAVQFSPPDDLRPGELGTLIDERANVVDVTATLVDLAVRGLLRIEEIEEPRRFRSGDWRLVRIDPQPEQELRDYETALYNAIFDGRDEVLLSELKQTFRSQLTKVQSMLYAEVSGRGWFRGNPSRVRARWMAYGVVLVLAGGGLTWLLAARTSYGLVGVAVVLAGLVAMALSPRMPARTASGTALLAQARGFRLYLETAEANQLRFEEGEDIFSRYLPYAIVFGVADRWAKVFAQLAASGAAVAAPTWYYGVGYGHGMFDYGHFGRSMDSFATTTSGSIAAATPSSSGSSGFSGGFSGGGGGGGGGGSW